MYAQTQRPPVLSCLAEAAARGRVCNAATVLVAAARAARRIAGLDSSDR